ncbi:MAG TPA: sugar-binding protein [Verrucomicrobiae bacterium]|jgi:ribose transport system substrate-binding protein|nr:sugar-binding protein [Verrucomicrobiae bacterium]
MKLNTLKTIIPALILAASISGCGQKNGGSTAENGGGKKLKLAFVSNNSANFWTIARAGCNDAAKELGNVDVDFRIPSSGNAAEQQQILNDLVAAGIDGIAASPIDPANQTDFLNKIASQVLFITTDSDAPESKRVCYIGTDNVAAGVQAGQMIKEVLPQGGKIMLFVGKLDAQNAHDRLEGIKKELAGSNVQIIDVRTDDADNVRAQKNAEDTLVKYPDIACLVGLYSYNGPAILNAVRGAGKAGKVKIVCFDEDADTLSGIASGDIYGTVVQQPYEFGKQAITRMAKYLGGDKTQLNGEGGKIFIPTREIKKDNVAEFQAQLKKLLGQ